ncbi:MAG: hypothetical protein LBS50_02500 [Prevotellaceae bacterium]|nr:hypothetical protein [Prevotellaceae bacterium]
MQKYKGIIYSLEYRYLMLLLALSCRFSAQNLKKATTKNNIFFPRKEKKEKRAKEEKRYAS